MKGFTSLNRRRNIVMAGACLAGGAALAFPQSSTATVIFNDTFPSGTSSQVDPATYPTPTSSSTGYDVFSTKTSTDGIVGPGDLQIMQTASSAAETEVEANFASPGSGVAMNVGDQLDLIVTFKDNGGILNSGATSSSALDFGLYSSNGTGKTPVGGLTPAAAAQLSATSTTYAYNGTNPGVAGYVGYVSQIFATGGSTTGGRIESRPAQTGGTNIDQDLVEAGASTSTSYTGSAQVGAKTTSAATNLTTGSIYTEDLNVTLTSSNTETFVSTLYQGAGTGGPVQTTYTAVGTAGQFLTSNFDTLAFGWYSKNTSSTASQMDVSQVEVLYTPVPEPATIGLLAVSCVGLLKRRVRKHA